jgi:hypothetical protein
MLPVSTTAAVGVKVALIVQVELAAKDVPQLFVSAKGAAAEIVNAAAVV